MRCLLIARAKDAGAKQVIVQATGESFAYEGYVRALREAGTDIFAIPLHGSIGPLHEWVSQTRGSFMETVRMDSEHPEGRRNGSGECGDRSSNLCIWQP